ncbi:hypothetical protein, partial [Mesorhizobium intechi]|uniref:hypothetical protein n=1 Tax=Mesorhizobium intechi TaxID=537601 RepID=UPI00142EF97F
RKMCKERYPERFDEISSHFAQSVPLLKRIAQKSRLECAHSCVSAVDDIEILSKGLATGDPELVWETYFVFMSKLNRPSSETFQGVFLQCWKLNASNGQLWKMIRKLDGAAFLTSEAVVQSVLSSKRPDIWLAYLDRIVECKAVHDFADICRDMDFVETASRLKGEAPDSDWKRVSWVLGYLEEGQPYPLGVGDS